MHRKRGRPIGEIRIALRQAAQEPGTGQTMKTNVIALDESQRAEYWADRIGKAHAASVEAIVNTGRELIAAKAKLAHGEWGRLTGRDGGNGLLPFSHQTAHRMMSVAGHSALSNVAHVRHLPPSWGTLAVLAQLPPPVIERHIYDGVLHPELTRADAEALVDEHKQALLQLAARAQVGRAAAYYTASRMLSSGELEVRVPSKPAVLGLAEPRQVEQAGAELEAVLMAWR